MQLVESSPKTAQLCRIVVVTNDGPLAAAVSKRTENRKNVYVCNDVEELKSLINTLASSVKEELIKKIKDKVDEYFFKEGNEESLYYKEGIREDIKDRYGERLRALPSNAELRKNGTWFISAPLFVKKKKQRITWKSRIGIVSKAYKRTRVPSCRSLDIADSWGQSKETDASRALYEGLTLGFGEDKLVADGRTTFEVTWSVTVTTKHLLRNPKIESIDFVGIDWEDKTE